MAEPLRITLEAARVNAGMSQRDIADYLGVSKKTIGNWESGRTSPNSTLLFHMLDKYGIAIENVRMPNDSSLSEKEVSE